MVAVRVGIVGDFDREKRSHWATEAALFHAAARTGLVVEPRWIPTPSVADAGRAKHLSELDGIWGAPGSPYVSMQGSLNAIAHARQSDIPYLGTCAGFQYALIEFTRNVLGVADADSAENDPGGKNIVIAPVECRVPSEERSRPALSGLGAARPVSDTLLERLCGGAELREEYFCNFETNAGFIPRWEAAGLRIGARGDAGEMRAFELPGRRFFVATLFQPQLSSSYERPHPIIEGYLRACATGPRAR
jgi:CTP synthase (UTP-ammonia lyase)